MNFFNQFTEDQMRAQYKKNALALEQMLAKAKSSKNGKCNGYTVEQLEDKAAQYNWLADNYTK